MDTKLQSLMNDAIQELMERCNTITDTGSDETHVAQHISEGTTKRKIQIMKIEDTGKKRKRVHGPVQPKNATCQLNELHPGLKYEVNSQSGPTHCPVFEVSVSVNGQTFSGKGRSKKMAKQAAAEAALASFVQFVNSDDVYRILSKGTQGSIDFTRDEDYCSFDPNSSKAAADSMNLDVDYASDDPTINRNLGQGGDTEKNPVMLLNEMRSGLVYEVTSEAGDPHAKVFTVKVVVDGEEYEGQGSSKKLAKAAAAKSILAELYNIKWMSIGKIDFGPKKFSQRMTDQIARGVQEKFVELLQSYPNFNRRGVLAGVAMINSANPTSPLHIIAVTTGTKCISGEHMSVSGSAVNDCHAEVLARRCLMDFLYTELGVWLNDETRHESIFELTGSSNKLNLKDDIKFHLYISTAPCGDARVFSPHEGDDDDRHPNRKTRGKLRTKIESGEGTIPVPDNFTQTWDGVLAGQRLLTMSCSDKIARWNVLGVQGALINHFVSPFYFESIIIGSLFHSQHMRRAIGGRIIDKLQGLPPPFTFHEPMLGVTSNSENRVTIKAPTSSIIWTLREHLEIINGITGKLEQGEPSRLAKASLFERFLRLSGPLASRLNPGIQMPNRYADAKSNNWDYKIAKEALMDAFNRAELGVWVRKPFEQDQFEMNN